MIKIIIGIGLLSVVGYSLNEYLSTQEAAVNPVDTDSLVTVVDAPPEEQSISEGAIDAKRGRIALLDTVTGTLTSESGQEMETFSAKRENLNPQAIQMKTYENGMVSATLGEQFQIPLVATIGCDALLSSEHAKSPQAQEPHVCGESQ